jgi:hypothetical protein
MRLSPDQRICVLTANDSTIVTYTYADLSALDPDAEAATAELDRLCMGQRTWLNWENGPYSCQGRLIDAGAFLMCFDEGVSLADIGVCVAPRSLPSVRVRLRLQDSMSFPDAIQYPLIITHQHAPEIAMPSWWDSWAIAFGLAAISRLAAAIDDP